jgi:hypothetical protein
VGTDVIRTPSDANQLEPAVQSVDSSIGVVQRALADGGYANADSFDTLEQQGVELYMAITREDHNERRYDFRPPSLQPFKKVSDPRLVAMRDRLAQKDGKRIYARRASTMEPVLMTFLPEGIRQMAFDQNRFEAQVDEFRASFDFDLVHRIMESLGWTWANLDRVPTKKELIAEAGRLLRELTGRPGLLGIGGLRASYKEDGTLSLKFSFSESWSDLSEDIR